jgi:uncharacterized protein YwbE
MKTYLEAFRKKTPARHDDHIGNQKITIGFLLERQLINPKFNPHGMTVWVQNGSVERTECAFDSETQKFVTLQDFRLLSQDRKIANMRRRPWQQVKQELERAGTLRRGAWGAW